jgi:hypothetical protein
VASAVPSGAEALPPRPPARRAGIFAAVRSVCSAVHSCAGAELGMAAVVEVGGWVGAMMARP